MFARLFLLFTAVPLVELYLLLLTGRWLGVPATVALALGTGALGAWLARSQGVATFARVRQQLASGAVPTDALVDGMLILVAGAVLLTPGLLTDVCGFLLLIPGSRAVVRNGLVRRWNRGKVKRRAREGVIDVEYREL
ncbi:MAG: FxsA family protein [Acidobacteriota bacterium]